MAPRDQERDERRRRRAGWPVRRFAVEDEPEWDERLLGRVAERVAAVWKISREAFSVAGMAARPSQPRKTMPSKIVRPKGD